MNAFKRARLVEGLTQTELAKKVGVSPVSVCKWEQGKVMPTVKRLKLIAEVLHANVEDLIDEEVG